MIYFVSNQQELFGQEGIENISVSDSLKMLEDCEVLQYDSETTGRDAHLCDLLCAQFGDVQGENQIVIDCSTVDITLYKDIFETKFLVGHNLKFDIEFLYNYGIIPRYVYDTMIVEQFIYLGYPPYPKPGGLSYSLAAVAKRHLDIDIDKSIRGEIIWRGLDLEVIIYAANDVKYLAKIAEKQGEILAKRQNAAIGANLENQFVPVIAYLEWCGIKLDVPKWSEKMEQDKISLNKAKEVLDELFIARQANHPSFKTNIQINTQGDLFEGFDSTPRVTINWDSSQQVTKLMKELGFDTSVQDKDTGEDKDRVLEKQLKSQIGIDDEFLKAYFDYKEHSKVCSTYGQSYINAINPKTGRIHTAFKQLGAASGRMACGSKQNNTDLARANKVSFAGYPQLQNLPANEATRSAFVSEKGNLFCSCDYSALESRLGADIYNEPHMINEFINGSGDIHSLMALTFFEKLMESVTTVKDVKKKYPKLRSKAKSPEFLIQFGGSAFGQIGRASCR